MEQTKESISAHFITLTYGQGKDDDGDYPRRTSNNLLTLSKRDLQLFWKRLRRLSAGSQSVPIKYYAAGEYGSNTSRPHYHAIVYNTTASNVELAWSLGSVHFGSVEAASIGYCLKYISKGHTVPRHTRDDRQREFSCMSKGLGSIYLTDAMIAWHRADPVNRVYAVIEDGKKISLPRYFKDRIFTDDQRSQIKEHFEKVHQDEIQFEENKDWLENRRVKRARLAQAESQVKKRIRDDDKI